MSGDVLRDLEVIVLEQPRIDRCRTTGQKEEQRSQVTQDVAQSTQPPSIILRSKDIVGNHTFSHWSYSVVGESNFSHHIDYSVQERTCYQELLNQ